MDNNILELNDKMLFINTHISLLLRWKSFFVYGDMEHLISNANAFVSFRVF